MKKMLFILITFVSMSTILCSCASGNTNTVKLDIGDSAIYNATEIESAMKQVQKRNKPKLTLETLMELAEKGEDLSWIDFEPYDYKSVGSGLIIQQYDINEEYYLLIGGPGPIMHITLISIDNPADCIDIRTESIDDFINR